MSRRNVPLQSRVPAPRAVYEREPLLDYGTKGARPLFASATSMQDSGLIRVYDDLADSIYRVNVGWLGDDDLRIAPSGVPQSSSRVHRSLPVQSDSYDDWELDSREAGRMLGRLATPGAWAAVAIIVLLVLALALATPAFAGTGGAISRYSDSASAVAGAGSSTVPVIDAGVVPADAPVPPAAETQGAVSFSGYSLIGAPSISVGQIEAVLQKYGSPAAGLGQKLYDLGVQYEIDPSYALAFFVHESGCGTQGVARFTRSLGNIRWTEGWDSYGGYRKYPTWEAGMEDWYKLITDLYINQWGLRTVDSIVPVYAPAGDGNSPSSYIASVKWMVDDWRGK